ncbi:MAG TPA: hypothetical protein VMW16_12780 [Sedimentisphaerales bacterium]|nr:hypothetical protein [Sedimentisphaerales bacterium]
MRLISSTILAAVLVGFLGCGVGRKTRSACAERAAEERRAEPSGAAPHEPVDLEANLGRVVTLEGVAKKTKIGASVQMGSGLSFQVVYLDWLAHWPEHVVGKRVRVSGTLVKRYDMAFWDGRGEMPRGQFQALPPGSDPREASKRYVLKDFTWELSEE